MYLLVANLAAVSYQAERLGQGPFMTIPLAVPYLRGGQCNRAKDQPERLPIVLAVPYLMGRPVQLARNPFSPCLHPACSPLSNGEASATCAASSTSQRASTCSPVPPGESSKVLVDIRAIGESSSSRVLCSLTHSQFLICHASGFTLLQLFLHLLNLQQLFLR